MWFSITCVKKASTALTADTDIQFVDCLFKTNIADIYAAYANVESKICVANIENEIHEYINDYRMMAAIPWNTVDIPINVKQMNHWVLAVLLLVERHIHIHVYDSYTTAGHDLLLGWKFKSLLSFCRYICPCIMTITWTIRKI
ncbi:hypothetical protein AABB24_037046 [Solanum stoloniferum]|uniref:Ubiquitin-like protease family profile domain-containing protein n=1 Tax=Solanum stoloniferum TaxID=62892 RepID=A0ABD2R5H5_9SOLN